MDLSRTVSEIDSDFIGKERPRKTKIGIEVAHVTRDYDTIFKVKRSRSHRGGGILWRYPTQLVLLAVAL